MLSHKVDKRLSYVPKTQTLRISTTFPFNIFLEEIPDLVSPVTINNYVRVYAMPQNANEFFIDRTGSVYFHQTRANQLVTINYMGGGSKILASDWNEMVDTLVSTRTLITDLTALVFGDIHLVVTPVSFTTTASSLNSTLSGQRVVNFTVSLKNRSNQIYTWLTGISLFVTVNKVFVDSDIQSPVIAPSELLFTNGVCTFNATYSTDYGAYKKYTSGDYVSYIITTVDPTSNLGINLTTTVVNSIQ